MAYENPAIQEAVQALEGSENDLTYLMLLMRGKFSQRQLAGAYLTSLGIEYDKCCRNCNDIKIKDWPSLLKFNSKGTSEGVE